MRSRPLPPAASAVWLAALLSLAACDAADPDASMPPTDGASADAAHDNADAPDLGADEAPGPPPFEDEDPWLAARPEDGPALTSSPLDAPHCSADGWCWQRPWWSSEGVDRLWAPGDGRIWGTARASGVVRWVDGEWQVALRLDGWTFHAIGGRGPGDVWVGGEGRGGGALFHLDGDRWVVHRFTDPDMRVTDIAVAPDGTLYASTDQGLITHRDGRWFRLLQPFGFWPGSRLVVDRDGGMWMISRIAFVRRLVRFDGQGWPDVTPTPIDAGEEVHMKALWAHPEGGIVAHGERRRCREAGDGVACRQVGSITGRYGDAPRVWERAWDEAPVDVSGAVVGADGTWTVGGRGLWHVVDGFARPIAEGRSLSSIVEVEPGRMLVGGLGGFIAEVGAAGLEPMTGSDTIVWPHRIWADGEQAWLVGRSGVARFVDGGWRPEPVPVDLGDFKDVHGVDPEAVWVVGDNGHVRFWDGRDWRRQPMARDDDLRAVWAAARDDVRAVGCGIHAFDGRDWTLELEGTECLELRDVHGSGPDDVWAVGGVDEPALWHFDGARWARRPAPPGMDRPMRVWAVEPGLVYVSDDVRLFRLEGEAWAQIAAEQVGFVSSIWASGPDDVWVGGTHVSHFDGIRWRFASPPAHGSISDLTGGDERVWAISASNYGGVLSHRR